MSLEKLGYTVKNDGFVFCKDENLAKNNIELLYLKECKRLPLQPTAVFFRRFYKDETSTIPTHSEPVVCIFNVQENFFDTAEHIELHRALWSAGKNEIYIIQTPTRLDIINAKRPAAIDDRKNLTLDTDELRLISDKFLKDFNDLRFATHLFNSGLFWEQKDFKSYVDESNTPHIFLLNHLVAARKKLHKTTEDKNLPKATIDKLLIISILIKFLEEIKDDAGRNTLKAIYQRFGVNSFIEIIKKNIIFDVLGELSKEFNGKIFDQFSKQEKRQIQQADLSTLIDFLNANIEIDSKQLFLWKQYNFKYLPAEVISAIYENFTGEGEKGVVYTPIHLVNMLIDEVMPLDKAELFKNERFKILDPACGSGVFLVAAYKRLLQWWVINNEKTLDSKTAKRILEENIYGVDIEETAVLVSVFGLTTALLDRLSPKEIWNNLKFKDLSEENIERANFKDWIAKNKDDKERYFDLVIGNPPFNPSSKGTITKADFKELLKKEVPQNKLALMFLESALYFGKKVCMIIPANQFLYSKSNIHHNYRTQFFTNNTVSKVYDFTHLRRILFHKTADTPVIALSIDNQPSEYQSIEHIIVKRQFQSEQKMRFEIDYYDRHIVAFDKAVNPKTHFVWKTNLLGGGRLFHLIYKLSLLRTFNDFILKKKTGNKWIYSVGYKVNHKNRKPKPASFITGKESIVTITFNENEKFSTQVELSDSFAEPRIKELYTPPLLIFKTNIGNQNIPIHLSKKYLCFKDKLLGLHAPEEEKHELEKIYHLFKDKDYSRLSRLFICATSSETLIGRETACKKEDIDDLPFSENKDYLQLSQTEKLIQDDVLKYYRYLAKDVEKQGKILHQPLTEKTPELTSFGTTFCDAMNELYETEDSNWQVSTVTKTPNYIIYRVGFGEKNGLSFQLERANTDEKMIALIDNDFENAGVRFKRVVRYYKHENGYDYIYFIKPNAKRYWLNSIALRDAGDAFMDLKKAGY